MPRMAWFVYPETFALQGPVYDGSNSVAYCSVECAEADRANEDALFEANADEGEQCPVCGKIIVNIPPTPSKKADEASS
ncbi:MAG: hypothetical protein IVW53_15870 [Chloroflexi bacterium]|nr:hypothetical protein [Chloroflexota bacterium]